MSGVPGPGARVTPSTLWVVAMFNYLYADVVTRVEVACTSFIVWYAWRWKEPAAAVSAEVHREAFNG